MATSPNKEKKWFEKISRSGYFFGALLLHLIVFVMVGTLVIFPAFHPPADDFKQTYLPPSAPPPPPPPQEPATVPTRVASTPTATITAPNPTATFTVPLPDITPASVPVDTKTEPQKIVVKPNTISPERLSKIMATETTGWGRDKNNILESNGDPRSVVAKFPVYLASYADGDWGCNVDQSGGQITAGSLPNLVAKMNEWSHNQIIGNVVPTPLDIGSSDLRDKKPPFIFFTGHKDFHLTDDEVKNLQDYLQVGGAIWGDSAFAGHGSRFDIAFHREMKRVVPDLDKNFVPVALTDGLFTKSWFPITQVPAGMNYYAEPIERLDIDGKLAILYTPNDYGDMFTLEILAGDKEMGDTILTSTSKGRPLHSWFTFNYYKDLFYRNYQLPASLACQQMGMNIIGYLLVRFDKDLLMTP